MLECATVERSPQEGFREAQVFERVCFAVYCDKGTRQGLVPDDVLIGGHWLAIPDPITLIDEDDGFEHAGTFLAGPVKTLVDAVTLVTEVDSFAGSTDKYISHRWPHQYQAQR